MLGSSSQHVVCRERNRVVIRRAAGPLHRERVASTAHHEGQEPPALSAPVGRLWYGESAPSSEDASALTRGWRGCGLGGGKAYAQVAAPYTDPDNGFIFDGVTDPVHSVTYGITLPAASTSSEFIGEIVAPVDAKWIGLALGGAMIGDLLIVAWPNAGKIVASTRYAT